MKKTLLLAALFAAVAVPAVAADAAREQPFALDLTAGTYGGAFDGLGVREDSGSMAIVAVSARPELRGERWRLEVPFRVAHRQTFGADLSETTGALDLEPWYQATKRVRLGLEAGALGASRPNWPDLYQREASGFLPPTDRYGYFAWRAGAQLYARPAPHQHLRARYRYVSYDYVEDPAFDPAPNPDPSVPDLMHLTPRDRIEHRVDTSWRYHQDTWAVGLRLDYTRRAYDTLLARTRRSGATPEDPVTGVELNPEQELSIWEPSVELELVRMGGKVELSLGYGLDVHDDPFQGYYSLQAHNPRAKAKLAITDRVGAEVLVEGWYATYGSDGSTRLEGTDTRRKDSRTRAKGELEYRFGGGLSMQAGVELVLRSTNYRDLVPPPQGTSSYDVDFDYTNFAVLAGLEYRL